MQIYKVTIPASGNIPIVPQDPVVQRNVSFQTLVIGSAAHIVYVGDSAVSSTNGIPIPALGAPLVIPTALLTQNLNGWFLAGTAADVVLVMVLE
jgi:hypothetical protein